jgi:hypothetical protein
MSNPAPALCYASLPWAQMDQARTLFETLRALHPDWRYVAVAQDAPPGAAAEGLEIVAATRAGFMDAACRERQAALVIHIDPRAKVTAPLTGLLAALDEADILLLARISEPAPDREGMLNRDLHVARTGTFNIGLLAVRTSGQGPAFAAWWADRTANYPQDIAPEGYADQRWCDLAPGLFDRVAIVRQSPPGLTLPMDR